MEKEAYSSVLRAFIAQSDLLSWSKERLITELRQELNVTDVEHGELLWKIISDESIKMIREWRKSALYVQDSLAGELNASRSAPNPMGHALEKKRKTSHASDSIFHKQEPHDDKGRGIVKSKTKICYHTPPYLEHLKEGDDVIQIRETKKLLHEIERMIYGRKGTDQVQVEMAKLILNDHERSLLLALAKLSYVSNDDDSRGEVRENKRQIVTHSRYHRQAGGLDSYPPESYPPKKSYPRKSYDPTHPVKPKVPCP